MKHLFTFWRNPNESNGSTCRGLNGGRMGVETTVKGLSSPFKGLGGFASLTLFLLLALCLGFSQQAWGVESSSMLSEQGCGIDTSYIVTTNLSTKDTIYIKHEDTSITSSSWWEQNKGFIFGILQVLLGAILGVGATLLTNYINAKKEERRLEYELSNHLQTIIAEEGVAKEQDIYSYFVNIPIAFDEGNDVVSLLDEMARKLDRYKIDIRPCLYADSLEWHTYWTNIVYGANEVRDTSIEKQLTDNFYKNYKS